jgi:hypothetical protein
VEVNTDSNGEFQFDGLTTGRYVVVTLPNSESGLYGDPVPFEILNDDLNGVEVRVLSGSSLSGIASLLDDKGESAGGSQFSGVTISAILDGKGTLIEQLAGRTQINPDGSFHLSGLKPGRLRLFLNSFPRRDFVLQRVELNGLDISKGIDIGSGDAISGVHLFLSSGTGNILGELKAKNGESLAGATGRLSAKLVNTSNSSQIFAEADNQGRFSFVNLPSGTYELQALVKLPTVSGQGNTFLSAKQNVVVKSNENTEIVLVVDSSRK